MSRATTDTTPKKRRQRPQTTHRPASGEDIYGNQIDSSHQGAVKQTKYVPPHLWKKLKQEAATNVVAATEETRNKNNDASGASAMVANPATLRRIQRSLNNSLNCLSKQTFKSVAKSIATLYS